MFVLVAAVTLAACGSNHENCKDCNTVDTTAAAVDTNAVSADTTAAQIK